MRILNVQLQNINSIKSDKPITIDFETDSFIEAGLFVITGSTGAGKTTILDAITIALYHQVPRFGKSHLKSSLEDVISHGAHEGMCRVEFTSGKKRYEAQWSMRIRKKSGEYLTNPVEAVRLKDLSNELIVAEKKKEMHQKIVEITQLSYQQFLRSMMLAQGEFAAFISANAKEKGNLLEQITGDNIYKQIGDQLNGRISQEEKKLKEIKSKINTDDLLSESRIDELNKELKEGTITVQEHTKRKDELKLMLDWFAQEEQLITDKNSLTSQIEKLSEDTLANTNQLILLKNIETAEPFSERFQSVNSKTKEHHLRKERLLNVEKVLETIYPKKIEASDQVEKSLLKMNEANELHRFWAPKLRKVRKMDVQIIERIKQRLQVQDTLKTEEKRHSAVRLNISDREKKIEGFTKELLEKKEWVKHHDYIEIYKANVDEWIKGFEQYNHMQKQTKQLSKELNEKEQEKKSQALNIQTLSANMKVLNQQYDLSEEAFKTHRDQDYLETIDQLETNNKVSVELLQNMKLAYRISQDFVNRDAEMQKMALQKSEAENSINNLTKSLENQDQLIIVREKSIIDIEKIIAQDRLIIDLEKERQNLVEGEACALCGSTEHPFVSNNQAPELESHTLELQKRKAAAAKSIEERQHIISKVKVEQNRFETTEKEIIKSNDQLKYLKEEFQKLTIEIEIQETDQITAQGKALKEHCDEADDKIQSVKKQQKEKEKQQKLIHEIKLKLDPLTLKQNKAETELNVLTKDIEQKQSQLDHIKNQKLELQSKLQLALQSADRKLMFTEQTDELLTTIKQSIQQYNEHTNTEKDLVQQIELLKSAQIHDQKLSEELSEAIKLKTTLCLELTQNIENYQELRSEILPQDITADQKENEIEKQVNQGQKELEYANKAFAEIDKSIETNKGLLQEHQTEIKRLIVEIEQIKAQLNTKIKLSSFESIDQVQKILEQLNQKEALIQLKDQLYKREIEIHTLRTGIEQREEVLAKIKRPEQEKEKLLSEVQSHDKQSHLIFQRQGEINQSLKMHKVIVDRNQSVVEKIEKQTTEVNRWRTLLNLLGGSKDAFNTYVQRLTLKSLIDIANIHLQKLNPRYALKLDEQYNKNEELTFKLVDYYQANETRNVETASGGEKFIMSLALALGLSDMSSQNVQIESLFIDEGFGTLDSELLETVISALESLKTQGKTIGVISHIDSLKERIPTQIHLQKKGNGTSEIQFFS